MSNHTKGPWRLQQSSESVLIVAGGDWSGNTWIASLPVPGPQGYIGEKESGEFKANAYLLAAAPELLKAAYMALDELDPEGKASQAIGRAIQMAENKIW